ncbi:MAG: metallophosphoesterase family protein [Beijerinckiaceae bacterium]
MRIAILADIHGNALALEAVMRDLAAQAPDFTVNLGDCLSGPLWPRETADLLMAQDWPTVRGNHDRWVSEQARSDMIGSDAFAYDAVDASHREWLRALPVNLRRGECLMFHARPDDDNAYLLESVNDQGEMALAAPTDIESRLSGHRATLVLCGHSHLPRVTKVGDALIVNPGSVGAPGYVDPTPPRPHVSQAGSPHARYAIATLARGAWTVDLRAIPYDWDRAAAQAERLGRPEWARALATGFVR